MVSKMSKFAAVATRAASAAAEGQHPVSAWESAAAHIFPDSPSSQRKGCPKSTFLGLAEAGLLVGVPEGKYTRSEHNKRYGLIALNIIRTNKLELLESMALWSMVMNKEEANKNHNAQMDVVIGLWLTHKIVAPHE